ncbi:MAG: hypothetical protein A3H98_09400 [Bacteroidetes bacterium RIFCSPLOWO2_02_FULL_36_8]|nr:MAG: hypothetical protein A3H98_09400 [Bacteroidetes bacterium RIFCSPLOWO2_02_FULL_36_8]OFY71929.1 MAG: hypothetical protein A3G23_05255 [Bacteroidetes bacterium RIFCSPLOWO2_12_FULL_37_12]
MKTILLSIVTVLLWFNAHTKTSEDIFRQKIGAGYSWMPPTNQVNLWYQTSSPGFIFDYNRHFRIFSRSMGCRQIDDPTVKSTFTQNLDATTHSIGGGYYLTADFLKIRSLQCGFPLIVYSGVGMIDIKSEQLPEGYSPLPDLTNKTFLLLGVKPGITISWNFHQKIGIYVSEYLDVQIEGLRSKAGENKFEYFNPYFGLYYNL